MLLKSLQAALDEFLVFLKSPQAGERAPLWEAQQIFQLHWDLEASDLAGMYARSLESTQTRRYWSGDDFRPREVMLAFMAQQQEYVRQVFADLFREERSVEGRLGRFVFGCDELLADHQERHPKDKLATHYHGGDYRMAFLYLAFRYPERYTLYDQGAFNRTLRRIGATDIPSGHDPERFVKVSRTLFQFLSKDEAIKKAHSLRLAEGRDYFGPSMLLVYDFMMALEGGR